MRDEGFVEGVADVFLALFSAGFWGRGCMEGRAAHTRQCKWWKALMT